jgi:hypothetical protein
MNDDLKTNVEVVIEKRHFAQQQRLQRRMEEIAAERSNIDFNDLGAPPQLGQEL